MGYQAEHPTTENLIPQAVLYRSLPRRRIRRNANGWKKRTDHAVRQSLRAGLYGHLARRPSLQRAYDYCAQLMQDALRPEDQYRLSSPYDLHECETTLSIEQTVIHALVTQLLEESYHA